MKPNRRSVEEKISVTRGRESVLASFGPQFKTYAPFFLVFYGGWKSWRSGSGEFGLQCGHRIEGTSVLGSLPRIPTRSTECVLRRSEQSKDAFKDRFTHDETAS